MYRGHRSTRPRRLEECAYRTQREYNDAQSDDEYDRLCAFIEMEKVALDWQDGKLLCWATIAEIDGRGHPIPPKSTVVAT